MKAVAGSSCKKFTAHNFSAPRKKIAMLIFKTLSENRRGWDIYHKIPG